MIIVQASNYNFDFIENHLQTITQQKNRDLK